MAGLGLCVVASLTLSACSSSKTPSGSPQTLLNDGVAAANAGNLSQARIDYQAVVKADPTNKDELEQIAWFDLGVIDQKEGNASAAQSEYQQALVLDPKYTNALYNLAVLETTANPQNAINLYQQVLALAPKDPNSMWNLGLLLYRTGQVTQGRTYLNQAIALAPSLASKLPAGVTLSP